MTVARQVMRRLMGLLVVGVLFLAPLVIWLVKKDPSPIGTIRVPGRVIEVVDRPDQVSGDATHSMVVELEGGEMVEFDAPSDPAAHAPGAEVTVLKSSEPDGDVTYGLEAR